MSNRYDLNYGWASLGPVAWDVHSIVTLQVDMDANEAGGALLEAYNDWWGRLDRIKGLDGEEWRGAGGCEFPPAVKVNDSHVTAWIVSDGEDAFDSIAYYADHVLRDIEAAVPQVNITWTELPHQKPRDER